MTRGRVLVPACVHPAVTVDVSHACRSIQTALVRHTVRSSVCWRDASVQRHFFFRFVVRGSISTDAADHSASCTWLAVHPPLTSRPGHLPAAPPPDPAPAAVLVSDDEAAAAPRPATCASPRARLAGDAAAALSVSPESSLSPPPSLSALSTLLASPALAPAPAPAPAPASADAGAADSSVALEPR